MLFHEYNHCLSKRKQKSLSPLSEGEIDQLLKGHVTAQAKENLQYAHGQESVISLHYLPLLKMMTVL